ncbi:hypothetical protein ENE74_10560 [Sphingobium algorifonticola]|uniref:Preprotein translocase subunit YajC n=2 Tax=Sphingobium algorifonticola TaxID=2008318 RepID=A0A437J7M8_9SPHN|nr:hypothetical protein ENE74_10560 [Sphingobium algorifonticola]
MPRILTHGLLPAALLASVAMPGAAQARTDVVPYLELNQIVIADLQGGSDEVLTYTSVAAGVDATITTRRAEVGVSARYEHRFGGGEDVPDQSALSGLLRGRANLIRDTLSIEGGAIATRVRTDGVVGANTQLTGNIGSTSQIYSGYIGPTLTTRVGDVNLNAAYRLGYTRVEDDFGIGLPGTVGLGRFDESVGHMATFSAGMQPGDLPFGWSVGGGINREDTNVLDQRFDDRYLRGDVTVPLSGTLAIVGGLGYEDVEISQRPALLDATGAPVLSSRGNLIADTSAPRLLSYNTDGLIWDVGVLWRPSRRTSLEARVGRRYGYTNYTGTFAWQPDQDTSVNIAVYDSIESFGRLLGNNLAGLSTDFDVVRNPLSGDINPCVFSTTGSGQCFNDALSAISGSNFRRRGIAGQFATSKGRTDWGVGVGYSRRTFIAPDSSIFASVDGSRDENYYANLFANRRLDASSGINGLVYLNYYDSGIDGNGLAGFGDVWNIGANAGYFRNFGRRLTATASVGVDSTDQDGIDTIISALGQVGLRYQF